MPLLTADQVAEVLAVKPRHLRDLVHRGLIPAVRVGRLVRFRPEDVEAFVAEHRTPAHPH